MGSGVLQGIALQGAIQVYEAVRKDGLQVALPGHRLDQPKQQLVVIFPSPKPARFNVRLRHPGLSRGEARRGRPLRKAWKARDRISRQRLTRPRRNWATARSASAAGIERGFSVPVRLGQTNRRRDRDRAIRSFPAARPAKSPEPDIPRCPRPELYPEK